MRWSTWSQVVCSPSPLWPEATLLVGVELERNACVRAGGMSQLWDGVKGACPIYHLACAFDPAAHSPH
jgi:hypothetical protein